MTRRNKLWRAAAAVFTFINVAGAGWALAMGESTHAMVHVALLLAGYVAWLLTAPLRREDVTPAQQLDEGRIEYLQQSVDAIALEVERIGEKQRFSDKLRVEQGKTPTDGR